DQLTAIHAFVRAKGFRQILEIGLGVGGSAVIMLDATEANLVTVDSLQTTLFKNRGVDNLKRAGVWDRVEFLGESSVTALHRLLLDQRRFDFVYIDGDHRFDTAFVD